MIPDGYSLSAYSAVSIGVALLLPVFLYKLATRSSLPYPPGPRGYPLVGYLKTVEGPTWMTYRKWSHTYGSDILRINTLGTNIIILNTLQAATDLLEKRSAIYSDRPANGLTMLRDLIGLDWNLGVSRYGTYWRNARKAFQQEFRPQAVINYRSVMTKASTKLLHNIHKSPETFRSHIRQYAGSQIIQIAYGLPVQDKDDPYIALAEHVLWISGQCMMPGAYLVDLLPFLRYLPEWFPGARFKKQARRWRKESLRLLNEPFAAMMNTNDIPTYCAAKGMVEKLEEARQSSVEDIVGMEDTVKGTLATMYAAGTDSTTSTLATFFLAMTLHPEYLKRAQESIDSVCSGNIPDFDDYDSLPYIHAIVKECLRWRPAAPIAFAHMSMEDDVYNGYYIPSGSIMLANTSAILHDPAAYDSPEEFNPERFLKQRPEGQKLEYELDTDVRDPMSAAFGFGRRICPGRFMAYESVWIVAATVVSVFDIEKAKDTSGRPMELTAEYTEGFLAYPKPFACTIRSRSSRHEAAIAATADSAEI